MSILDARYICKKTVTEAEERVRGSETGAGFESTLSPNHGRRGKVLYEYVRVQKGLLLRMLLWCGVAYNISPTTASWLWNLPSFETKVWQTVSRGQAFPSIRGTRLYTVFSKDCGRVTISWVHLREGCALGRNHTKKISLQCRRFMQTPKCTACMRLEEEKRTH